MCAKTAERFVEKTPAIRRKAPERALACNANGRPVQDPKTISIAGELLAREARTPAEAMALVIAWCSFEPGRIGEVALFSERGATQTLGRGDGDGEPRVRFFRQRPGRLTPTEPFGGLALSRSQVTVAPGASKLVVTRTGRCALAVNGADTETATLAPGDTLLLRGQLLLFCMRRTPQMPKTMLLGEDRFGPFGAPDAMGILGESPLILQTRERVAFAATAGKHVLVHGESGSGKELVARAVHGLSPRAAGPFVSRNAATLPPALIDAELFGNAKNYPNPGMAERRGLIGEADRGTLFLDEIAELPLEQQSHLLRVLDAGGEHQRLGDPTLRKSDLILVGATNKDLGVLREDLAARFPLRVPLPSLDARREDIPLLARHILLRAADESPRIAARFVRETEGGRREPSLDAALVEELLVRPYATNIRELEALLWRAMAASPADTVILPDELRSERAGRATAEPNAEAIRAALAGAAGSVQRAARALGLPSRYALYRLMKKHAIEVDDASAEPREE